MAEKSESSLIGYDPLAWMHQQAEEQQVPSAPEESSDAVPEPLNVAEQVWLDDRERENAGWQDMAFEAAKDSASTATGAAIMLEPVLSIQNVAQLHERLLAALDNNNKIEIDASAVTIADTATLQLLLILKRTAIKLQKEVVIDFPSDRFVEAAGLLGISEMLEVDQAAAGFF